MSTYAIPFALFSIIIAACAVTLVLIWNRKLHQQATTRALDLAKLLQDYKNTAQALRKSQAQLNAIVNHLPCDLWVFDHAGMCVLQNSNATDRWGPQTNTHLSDLCLPDRFLNEFKRGQQSAMRGEQIEKELHVKDPKDNTKDEESTFLYKTAPVQSKHKIFGSVTISIDITELKDTQAQLKQETSFSRLFMDNLPALFYLFNRDGQLLKWNANFERISGYKPTQLQALYVEDLFSEYDQRRISERTKLLDETGFAALEAHLHTQHGRKIPFYFTGTLIEHEGVDCILGCGIDISERKKAEQALSLSEERFRLAFESAPIGMALVNMGGYFIQVNGQLSRILGYSESELKSLQLKALEIESEPHNTGMNDSSLYSKIYHSEKKLAHKEGHTVWVQLSTVLINDIGNNSQYYVVQIADITERKELVAKLHKLAFHDALTGLPNRKLFTEFLDKALAKSRREPDSLIALIFIDLDRFKRVNDSLGHLAGDQLLRSVSQRLKDQLRPADTIARFAGDEFVVLLDTVTNKRDAIDLAQRLQDSLDAPFEIGGQPLTCKASMGISIKPVGTSTAEVLLRDADTAMYQAKEQGRGRAVMFDPVMHTQAKSHLDIETRLRATLKEQSMLIHYQPIVSMSSGRISALEALIRWPDQKNSKNLLLPQDFLPIAAEAGLLIQLDRWVLQESLKQLAKWKSMLNMVNTPLAINVNFSSQHILTPDFVDFLREQLQRYQIPPQFLNIEITESTLLDDNLQSRTTLEALRRLGVNIHLDDFGTGYSALSYLYKFPIDSLKIDKAFIKRMLRSEKHLAIVRSIILLAKTQNIRVIAEGIETQEQFDKLLSMQCGCGQGYLISKPLPAQQINKLLLEDPCWINEEAASV